MPICNVIKIQTPKGYLLNGLWYGPEKAKTVFVYIHGLGGSLFSQTELCQSLTSHDTAVLVFNNRGSGVVSRIKRVSKKGKKGYDSHTIGMAHEVFSDCVDDIDGAIELALDKGAKNIFLVGHSTGCQKSVYYLSQIAKKKKPKPKLGLKLKVKGAILLAPMSDYADFAAFTDNKKRKVVTSFAKKMIKNGKAHDLLPKHIWPYPIDSQRFLSLFTPESTEEIFSYAVPDKSPKILMSVKTPMKVIFAGDDEYKDRPMEEIAAWFKKTLADRPAEIEIIDGAPHNFKGYETRLKTMIKAWKDGLLKNH